MLSTTKSSVSIRYLDDNKRCEAVCGVGLSLGVPFDQATQTKGTAEEAEWVRWGIACGHCLAFASLDDLLPALAAAERKRAETEGASDV